MRNGHRALNLTLDPCLLDRISISSHLRIGTLTTTRAYARIIDEVNKLPLSALQRPEEPGTP